MRRDALVVGINVYGERSQLKPLSAPAHDAEAIARLLSDCGNFSVTRLSAVFNKDNDQEQYPYRVGQKTPVSRNDLRDALTQLFNPEGRAIPDVALFYFSGHGLRETSGGIQEGYLANSDANPDLGLYGLSLQWLRRLLQASPVRQQIVWLDCCYAGELLNFEESLGEATLGQREHRDRCFIAACREYESAFESVISNHGVLTGALLKALDPKQHVNQLVTNLTLTEDVSLALRTAAQRPLFANFGNQIALTGTSPSHDLGGFSLENTVCPYRGLAYFDCQEEDARFFHGRRGLTDMLVEKVRTGNFVAVLGASGSGKSSVVRAGLLYQLKQGQQSSTSDRWSMIAPFRPGEHPLQSLAEALVEPNLRPIDRAAYLYTAQKLMNAGGTGLIQLVNAYQTERVVLVIDQFEECFMLCRDRAERQQFFKSLLETVEHLGHKLCLVLTLRADFLGKWLEQGDAEFARKIQENLITVSPLSQEELRQAITRPAEQVSLQIEPELVNQMILDIEHSPGSLPLLQYTLTQLWQRRAVNCSNSKFKF